MLMISTLVASAALGCGGSKKSTESGGGTGEPVVTPATDAQAQETPEAKFARQKDDAVDKMCQRLIDCSVEDAKREMPPEELAKLDLENTSRQALSDCNDAYGASAMSPRQVMTLRECLGQPTECPDFNACLAKLSQTEAPAEP
jgi:hypothetical protein